MTNSVTTARKIGTPEESQDGYCWRSKTTSPFAQNKWILLSTFSNLNQKKNTLIQLSMGKGKSSVIIPMLAIVIADGDAMARIMCLNQLREQTLRLLSERLGGIINRTVYHLPFSRTTTVDEKFLDQLGAIHTEIIAQGGILIARSEEVLAFRLLIEEKVASKPELAGKMLEVEEQLRARTRDILDESDEILDPKFQLLFTLGAPQMIEGHPERWTVAMEVLERLAFNATVMNQRHPMDLELTRKDQYSFPTMRFLRSDVIQELILMLVDDMRANRIEGLPLQFASNELVQSLMEFISKYDIPKTVADDVTAAFGKTPHIMQVALLLRGYVSQGILRFVFENKRWSVDFGLNLERSMLAVPYRAKGVPHSRSEFGHADIAILLTCLAYYYSGLTKEQLLECFQCLLRGSNAVEEYTAWCQPFANLPENLHSLDSVNIDDKTTFITTIYPYFQYNKKVIDYFLRKSVFPKHATEFTERLCASGWDIPSVNEERLTVGFSGTNDNRSLLPLTIHQSDVSAQQHTNAMIVDLLLRYENQECICPVQEDGSALSTVSFLKLLASRTPPVNVLIDIGAQVLDLLNREVAGTWLGLVPTAKGAVYFNESHESVVLERSGRCSPLFISPLKREMDKLLIFLDECHTRGIDLPIPAGIQAMVTLGPRLAKDRLAQGTLLSYVLLSLANNFLGTMRLRKLGCGHSLSYIAPPEVHQEILAVCGKTNDDKIDSFDILKWTMEQTCQQTQQHRPLWVANGISYAHRMVQRGKFIPNSGAISRRQPKDPYLIQFMKNIQEPEKRDLMTLYGVANTEAAAISQRLKQIKQHDFFTRLNEEWAKLDPNLVARNSMTKEQEREIAV
jgi:hypothetical protein